jgi:hypothetical protein
MSSQRFNEINTGGANVPADVSLSSVWVTNFPRPAGQTITVTRLNGAMSAAGVQVGDLVERDSDGGFWDTVRGIVVPCDYTSLQAGNDMLSA